jgi:hypothetical protein
MGMLWDVRIHLQRHLVDNRQRTQCLAWTLTANAKWTIFKQLIALSTKDVHCVFLSSFSLPTIIEVREIMNSRQNCSLKSKLLNNGEDG